MSTSSISSTGLTSSSSISSTGQTLQVTGLASGMDTNAIVQAMLSDQTQRITNLTSQQTGLKALNTQLTSIQSSLQTLALNAQALGDPGLFDAGQTVTSSNSSIVSATTATGAGVGGYQVGVGQLANSAQGTFSFSSPTSDDTIKIDGIPETIAAGSTIQDFVNQINSDPNADVYAATTDSGTVVLSSRSTGYNNGNLIQVSDPSGKLTQKLDTNGNAIARAGQDAKFSVDGVSGSSSTNTVTNAVPGVTLTLGGVTSPDGVATDGTPVTVVVGAPAASTSAIDSAVTTFVNAYNAIIDQINGQVTQTTSTSDPTQGLLFGDNELTGLLSNMRSSMYTPGTGLPAGLASLADIGISTGAASGSSPYSQDSVSGKLTVNMTALNNAIQTNPNGVKAVLSSWSTSFASVVNNEAGPGGAMDARIQGDSSEVSDIGNQIDSLNTMLSARQTALQAEFAQLEATLSTYQSQGSWLTQQINSLPLPGSL
jgi:flagellar hook-associated protein 2